MLHGVHYPLVGRSKLQISDLTVLLGHLGRDKHLNGAFPVRCRIEFSQQTNHALSRRRA
jgi:hypothetical protein